MGLSSLLSRRHAADTPRTGRSSPDGPDDTPMRTATVGDTASNIVAIPSGSNMQGEDENQNGSSGFSPDGATVEDVTSSIHEVPVEINAPADGQYEHEAGSNSVSQPVAIAEDTASMIHEVSADNNTLAEGEDENHAGSSGTSQSAAITPRNAVTYEYSEFDTFERMAIDEKAPTSRPSDRPSAFSPHIEEDLIDLYSSGDEKYTPCIGSRASPTSKAQDLEQSSSASMTADSVSGSTLKNANESLMDSAEPEVLPPGPLTSVGPSPPLPWAWQLAGIPVPGSGAPLEIEKYHLAKEQRSKRSIDQFKADLKAWAVNRTAGCVMRLRWHILPSHEVIAKASTDTRFNAELWLLVDLEDRMIASEKRKFAMEAEMK